MQQGHVLEYLRLCLKQQVFEAAGAWLSARKEAVTSVNVLASDTGFTPDEL